MRGKMITSKVFGALPRLGCLYVLSAVLGVGVTIWYGPLLAQGEGSYEVLRGFIEEEQQQQEPSSDVDSARWKHRILFLMGLVLLASLLAAAGLGVAMGIYGKPVLVLHMVLAGFSVTLALVHAIVSIIWFFPF